MSTQQPDSSSSIAQTPSPRYGSTAVVYCACCGTKPADSLSDAKEQSEWLDQFGHVRTDYWEV